MVKKCVCIPSSFLVINVCNQGKSLCSPCSITALPVTLISKTFWEFPGMTLDFFLRAITLGSWGSSDLYRTSVMNVCAPSVLVINAVEM